MNLEAFRRSVLDAARREARRCLDDADAAAQRRLDEARAAGRRLEQAARDEGRGAAELDASRRRAEARRTAHERVLCARREALERLRGRALDDLAGQRGGEAYDQLLDRLEAVARRQLGPSAVVDRDPAAGGLAARCDGRRVDYGLEVLVDDELDAMGAQLRELWS